MLYQPFPTTNLLRLEQEVCVHGLNTRPELNGQRVRVIAPLDPILTGLRITFAGFVWDAFFSHAGAPSNPVDVILR